MEEKALLTAEQAGMDVVARNDLESFAYKWQSINHETANAFQRCLESAKREEDLQRFIASHPELLVQLVGGGHGRFVIPKKRLGSEHVTDFMVGHCHSFGFEWIAVELESPLAKLFTKKGDPGHRLTHGIRQIHDWRIWLKNNQNYASRLRSESGLGLRSISQNVPGLVLIGRHADVDPETNERRTQMCQSNNLKIHTFDTLLTLARNQAKVAERMRARESPRRAPECVPRKRRVRRLKRPD